MEEEKFYVSGEEVTKEVFDEGLDNGDICQCNDCGEYFYSDDGDFLFSGEFICHDCADSGDYFRCNDCGDLYHIDEDHVYMVDSESTYCDNCLCNMDYYCCDHCGRHFEFEYSGRWDEHSDCWYCDEHRPQQCIHGYHSGPAVTLLGDGPADALRFGFEFEVNRGDWTDWDDLNAYAEKVYEIMGEVCNDIEEDGSVDSGFEIQTNPMTWDYYQEKGKHIIEQAMEYLKMNDFSNYDDQCGVHIHFTKAPIESAAPNYWEELYLLINAFAPSVIDVAGREDIYSCDNPYFYSECLGDNNSFMINKCKELIKNRYLAHPCSRYQPLNVCPHNTLEWRIFSGTTNFNKIDDYINMSYKLVKSVMNHNYLGKTFCDITGIDKGYPLKYTVNYREERKNRELRLNIEKFVNEALDVIINKLEETPITLGREITIQGRTVQYEVLNNNYNGWRDNGLKRLADIATSATNMHDFDVMEYMSGIHELYYKYIDLEARIINKYKDEEPKPHHRHGNVFGSRELYEKYKTLKKKCDNNEQVQYKEYIPWQGVLSNVGVINEVTAIGDCVLDTGKYISFYDIII